MTINLVSHTGVTSCIVGGVLRVLAFAKGKEASQLESVTEIEKLSGAAPVLSHTQLP